MALACFGLASRTEAAPKPKVCSTKAECDLANNPYCCVRVRKGVCSTYMCSTEEAYTWAYYYCRTQCPP